MGIATAAIVGASVAAVGAGVGAIGAHQDKQRAKGQMMTAQRELDALEKNRQDVINPYEGVTNLSEMIEDVSSIASNPYQNLSVSTAAAEMQVEEADIALANTLDTLRATGASAGGATALARMALESKKGVSASIQQQEANNEKLRADGEAALQTVKLNEAKRVQSAKLGQAEKMQEAEVEGAIYEFETQESRDEQQMNRKQGQIDNANRNMQQAQRNKNAAISGGITAVGNIFSNPAAFKK